MFLTKQITQFLTLALTFLTLNFQAKQNKYISLDIKIEKLEPNVVTLLIFLRPTDGIYINSEPEPRVNFSDSNLEIVSFRFEKADKNYIDTKKPIEIKLKLKSKNTKSIAGELTYFYCSELEGWCSKSTDKFEVKL